MSFRNNKSVNTYKPLTILNVYAFNNSALKYMKQKLVEIWEVEKPTVTGSNLVPPQKMWKICPLITTNWNFIEKILKT